MGYSNGSRLWIDFFEEFGLKQSSRGISNASGWSISVQFLSNHFCHRNLLNSMLQSGQLVQTVNITSEYKDFVHKLCHVWRGNCEKPSEGYQNHRNSMKKGNKTVFESCYIIYGWSLQFHMRIFVQIKPRETKFN